MHRSLKNKEKMLKWFLRSRGDTFRSFFYTFPFSHSIAFTKDAVLHQHCFLVPVVKALVQTVLSNAAAQPNSFNFTDFFKIYFKSTEIGARDFG